MATYVYRCPTCGVTVDEYRPIEVGPYPTGTHKTEDHETERVVVIQPSSLRFGDFEIGDDDFSLRYRGMGVDTVAKRNNTQGKTNVNAIIRKWGKKGKPLEARTDIDPTKITKGGLRPPGVEGSLEAPPELRSSYAKGVSTSEIAR